MRRLVGLGALALSALWLAVTAGPALSQSPNGTVTATVQVQAAACITVNPTSFAYPAAPLSNATAPSQVVPAPTTTKPVATNCSTAAENFLARGGSATGGGATWTLISSIDCSAGTADQYRHDVRPSGGAYTALSTTDQAWESSVAPSNTRTLDTRLTMPCTGSGGVGQTMSMPIVLTAIVQ